MKWPFVSSRSREDERNRSLSLQQYIGEWLNYDGHRYGLTGYSPVVKGAIEVPSIDGNFGGLARGAFKSNGIVFACMEVRKSLFSEARFKFRELRPDKPGNLFGTAALSPLEVPWPNGTTRDLLARMEQDVSLSGNFYARITRSGLQRMRPDWVHILLGSDQDPDEAVLQLDAEVIGYAYFPGGPSRPGVEPVPLDVTEVVHYAPTPDPEARFRGMSWLTPVIREVMADSGYTDHKIKFLENGAVTNLFMVMDKDVSADNAKVFEEAFRARNEGPANRWKTLFVGGGATPTPVGSNFVEMDFKVTQGAGETRIAAAAGTPPVLVGLSEGLQGSSLNQGNYGMARRRFADITMRPLWGAAAAALAPAVAVPAGSELWYDDRQISALQEDQKDAAEIRQADAATIRTLVEAGFDPGVAVAAVMADDLSPLAKAHTGLVSVQLQEPGANPAANGLTPARELASRIIELAQREDD